MIRAPKILFQFTITVNMAKFLYTLTINLAKF